MNEDKAMFAAKEFSNKSILQQKAANDQLHANYKAHIKEHMANYCGFFVQVNDALLNNKIEEMSQEGLERLAQMALAYFSIVQNDVLEEVGPDYYVQQ